MYGGDNLVQNNPFLKKSTAYVKSLIIFILLTVTILAMGIFALLSVFDIVALHDSLLKFMFAFLGFLLPIEKSAYEKLNESSPWETYLNYLIKKEKLSAETRIRISYAAVVVVEFNGEYLLLKNTKGIELFQFPSWTYGLSDEEAKKIEIKFSALKDSYIKRDYNDYRFSVPVKNIKSFYKYFCEQIDPYNYSCSNIVEDFAKKCSLNSEVFSNSKTFFKWRKIEKIKYSRYTDEYEMNVRDVYVLCLTDEQKNELQKIQGASSDAFRWATEKEIKQNGINEDIGKLHADIATFTYEIMIEDTIGWVTVKNYKL